jgi:hypothetical protein
MLAVPCRMGRNCCRATRYGFSMNTNNLADNGIQKAVLFYLRSGAVIRVPCRSAEVRFDDQTTLKGYTLTGADGVILHLDIKEVVAVTIDWMNDECPKAL